MRHSVISWEVVSGYFKLAIMGRTCRTKELIYDTHLVTYSATLLSLHSNRPPFTLVQEWIVTNHSRVGSGGGSKRLADSPDMEDLSLDKEKSPPHFTPEYLTLCGKDGSTYQLSVEGGKLKNLTQTPLHVSEA